MMIQFLTDQEAYLLLRDKAFNDAWRNLYARCPWATPFQDAGFVTTWYESYRDQFHPVIVREESSGGQLAGLLTLAVSADSCRLLVAGGHQAEYHTWLEPSAGRPRFLEAALTQLRERYPGRPLLFRFLPPLTPMDWVSGATCCRVESVPRPLWIVGDRSKLEEVLRKSRKETNRRFNGLRRLGDLRLEHIRDPAGFRAVFDTIIAYYDFRQGALHGESPFRHDPLKKTFFLRLMEVPDLLHVTVLRLGNRVIAAQLGLAGRGTLHGVIPAYSSLDARHSPGIVHTLMLGQHLADTGFQTFDLTPGNDSYKERFASDHDYAHQVMVFPGRWPARKHDVGKRLLSSGKGAIEALGIEPESVKAILKRVRRVRPREIASRAYRAGIRLCRSLLHTPEMRVYIFPTGELEKAEPAYAMAKDSVEDLLAFEPAEPWQDRQSFLAEALARLALGSHAYTRVEEGRLVHYGWLVERQHKAFIREGIDREYQYAANSAVLHDFRTHPDAQGRGLFQAALRQMLHDAFKINGTQQVYILVRADNGPSRHAIEKVGFTYECSLYGTPGLKRLWRSFRKRLSWQEPRDEEREQ